MFRWRVQQTGLLSRCLLHFLALHKCGMHHMHAVETLAGTDTQPDCPRADHDDLGRGSEHPTAEGRDRPFYSISVATIRWYARANEVSGVFPHMKTCLLCTNVTTRDTLTILNPSSVIVTII